MYSSKDTRTIFVNGKPHHIVTEDLSENRATGFIKLGLCPLGSSGVHSVHKLPNHWYQNPFGRIFANGKHYNF